MGTKTGLFLLFMASLIVTLPACWERQTQEKKAGLVVINVLDKQLHEDCHIAGSINVPFELLDQCAQLIDRDAEIVVYCSNYMCATSEYAGKKLRELGFKKVLVYEGGTAEWFQKGLPVEGPSKSLYLTKRVDKTAEDGHSKKQSVILVHELAQKMGITFAPV